MIGKHFHQQRFHASESNLRTADKMFLVSQDSEREEFHKILATERSASIYAEVTIRLFVCFIFIQSIFIYERGMDNFIQICVCVCDVFEET